MNESVRRRSGPHPGAADRYGQVCGPCGRAWTLVHPRQQRHPGLQGGVKYRGVGLEVVVGQVVGVAGQDLVTDGPQFVQQPERRAAAQAGGVQPVVELVAANAGGRGLAERGWVDLVGSAPDSWAHAPACMQTPLPFRVALAGYPQHAVLIGQRGLQPHVHFGIPRQRACGRDVQSVQLGGGVEPLPSGG